MDLWNCLVLFPLIAISARSNIGQSQSEPKVDSIRIVSKINYRYAHTYVISNITNKASKPQELVFSVIIPTEAFITSFSIFDNGVEYKSYLRENNEAREKYVSKEAAALIELQDRVINQFQISVHVKAKAEVMFVLHYEELLARTLGAYSNVISLNTGQVVKDMQVDVYITDSLNITNVKVQQLIISNEFTEIDRKEITGAVVMKNGNPTHVQYKPPDEFLDELEDLKYRGELVVSYDVDRSLNNGSQLIDGYFVHFFAPSNLPTLRKYVVFTLDISGSMNGTKLTQLKESMETILNDLNPNDYFNIVDFSNSVTLHHLESSDSPMPSPYPATKELIKKAINLVSSLQANGRTDICGALNKSISLVKNNLNEIQKIDANIVEPMIMFLTDGMPTQGEINTAKIISIVKRYNKPKSLIFSLAFGKGSDKLFLRKLSLSSSAFARSIYEGADATIQLESFYKEISSPLLMKVNFTYGQDQVILKTVVKEKCPTLFKGSEMVVAGKISNLAEEFHPSAEAITFFGKLLFTDEKLPMDEVLHERGKASKPYPPDPEIVKKTNTPSPLGRLWAYLQIKRLIDQELDEPDHNRKSSLKNDIIKLAMKEQFVTPFTSLVVVRPYQDEITRGLMTENEIKYKGYRRFPKGPRFRASRIEGMPLPSDLLEEESFKPLVDDSGEEKTTSNSKTSTIKENRFKRVKWLSSVYHGIDEVWLAFGSQNITKLKIRDFRSSVSFGPCTVKGSFNGTCKHLIDCIQDGFLKSLDAYMPYFCSIEQKQNYIGACCPDDHL